MNCHTLVCDQVKLSWFKVIELCQGSIDPAETWWHRLITKEFITKLPLDSKGIPKSLHERLTSYVSYYHNCLWAFSASSWSSEFSSQMCKCETLRILYIYIYIYIYIQSQACTSFILEFQLKSKISHSLIHMGFTGLIMWSRVREPWKKGLERLKECLRVILSKNLESLACILFISTFELGCTPFVLYINLSLHFCAFLVNSGDLCLSFFSSLAFGGFIFSFSLLPNSMHVLFT